VVRIGLGGEGEKTEEKKQKRSENKVRSCKEVVVAVVMARASGDDVEDLHARLSLL
jgi:hypothetical protein